MKKLLLLLLGASLLLNAWSGWRHAESGRTAGAATHSVTLTSTPTVTAVKDRAGSPTPPIVLAAADAMAAALATGDMAAFRDRLVAAGVDQATMHQLMASALRQRFAAEAAAWRIEHLRTSWWRNGGTPPEARDSPPSARTLVDDPLRALLGPDPLELESVALRYGFLPPEKRRKIAAIEVDYNDLIARTNISAASRTKAEQERQALLNQERRRDIAALLSPEELAEYELRTDDRGVMHANQVQRYATMAVTETELHAIAPILAAFTEATRPLLGSAPDFRQKRDAIDRRALDQMVDAIGYERTVEFSWASSDQTYRPTLKAIQELGLPRANASLLLELGTETGVKAMAIHRDEALTVDQKRAALRLLQAEVRSQVDALVPTTSQARLPTEAIGWLSDLGEGRYVWMQPNGMVSGGSGTAHFSVDKPLNATLPPLVLPRRSTK